MTIPNVIEKPYKPDSVDGIFSYVKRFNPNIDILSIFKPSTDGETIHGTINGLVEWSNWQCDGSKDCEYVQIEFVHKFIYPVGYALKGYYDKYYAKEWSLYGLDENKEETLIASNSSKNSHFCGDSDKCLNDYWGTFTFPPIKKAFRYLRWKKDVSQDSWIAYGGIEVFGVLSTDKRTYFTRHKTGTCKSSKFKNHFPISLFFIICNY